MVRKIVKWWQSLRYYVVMDPADNSVTLSKRLFRHIRVNAEDTSEAKVFVFHIPEHKAYGFMINPKIEQPTQLCDIQYNGKYKCIGFETLCPSVGSILYDYDLPYSRAVKMSVSVQKSAQGKIYYQLERPHAKHIRKLTQG